MRQETAYLQAAGKLSRAADIQYLAWQAMVNNQAVKTKYPDDYEALCRYYGQQALALYQQVFTACYSQLALSQLFYFQRVTYVERLMRLANLCTEFNQAQAAKHYYQQAAEQSLQAMHALGDMQAAPLKQLTMQCYTQYEQLLLPKADDRGIKVLHRAAQWYMQLAMLVGEEQLLYIEKAYGLYRTLAQLCQGLKMNEERRAYLNQARYLEQHYLSAQAVQSPAELLSQPQPTEWLSAVGLYRRSSRKISILEQEPLLQRERDAADEGPAFAPPGI